MQHITYIIKEHVSEDETYNGMRVLILGAFSAYTKAIKALNACAEQFMDLHHDAVLNENMSYDEYFYFEEGGKSYRFILEEFNNNELNKSILQ